MRGPFRPDWDPGCTLGDAGASAFQEEIAPSELRRGLARGEIRSPARGAGPPIQPQRAPLWDARPEERGVAWSSIPASISW